ncbi:serine/threonine-protein kinase [Streptomyces sp. NPDC093589]|uniref:serine/threonine-protein kinase n=1 Tax=Streptomyces sp. NPDC093589 TaxID=3366043 RepID=UPI003814E498
MEPLTEHDPRVLGGYRLLGRLGAGGMGRVYLGRSAGGRTVAVKAVHAHFAADDQFRARFRREIESARRVGGAWTAPVLDADPDAPVPWIATGYVAGPSLAQAVTDVSPLAEHSVRTLGAGLAEALAAVHALGLVHRDVKPSNVLLTLDGPLLIDFGIARATEGTASLTSTGVSVGSPGYMAPEQILGDGAAGAADVFSLGAVLAYAATGVSPFGGDSSAALLYKVVHEEPRLGPELTGELRDLVAGCLAKRPGDRPAPDALAARFAGGGSGAAERVRAGWLPGPLVEQVSRQAVELLNLDTGAPGAGERVPGQAAAVDDAVRTPLGGAFGPPDPSYGAASGLVPFEAQAQIPAAPAAPPQPTPWPVAGAPGAGHHGPGPGTGLADQPTGPPSPAPYAPTAAPGAPKERRIALTGAVGAKDRGDGAPRRVSCSLVLSVAGALAAATTAAVVFQVLPGTGGGDTATPPNGAAKPSRTVSPSPGAPDGAGGGTVAKGFLGTWTGSVTTRSGFPNGRMTSVIKPGAKGDYVIHTTYDAVVLRCEAKAKLESSTAGRLVLVERPDGKQGPGCTGNRSTVTYTLGKNGSIAFTSDDDAGGTPKATLTKK